MIVGRLPIARLLTMKYRGAKVHYFRGAGLSLSEFCNRFRFLAGQRAGKITLPRLVGIAFWLYLRPADISGTSLTFLRAAISSAMSNFSASDNIRAAKGNTRLSSTPMCCLYIDARLATALRKSSTSVLDRLPVERYRAPRRSTSVCNGAAQRCSSRSEE